MQMNRRVNGETIAKHVKNRIMIVVRRPTKGQTNGSHVISPSAYQYHRHVLWCSKHKKKKKQLRETMKNKTIEPAQTMIGIFPANRV